MEHGYEAGCMTEAAIYGHDTGRRGAMPHPFR